MTRERAKELLPIIQAYAEGKEIEYFEPLCDKWLIDELPFWNDKFDYRIKEDEKTCKTCLYYNCTNTQCSRCTHIEERYKDILYDNWEPKKDDIKQEPVDPILEYTKEIAPESYLKLIKMLLDRIDERTEGKK